MWNFIKALGRLADTAIEMYTDRILDWANSNSRETQDEVHPAFRVAELSGDDMGAHTGESEKLYTSTDIRKGRHLIFSSGCHQCGRPLGVAPVGNVCCADCQRDKGHTYYCTRRLEQLMDDENYDGDRSYYDKDGST
jgi:hypothetical protein